METVVDHDYLHNILVDLVGINSINPSLVPTGAGEAEIAARSNGAAPRRLRHHFP